MDWIIPANSITRLVLVLAGALLPSVIYAANATLVTQDHRTIKGDLAIETNGFKLTPPGGHPQVVELSRMQLLQVEYPDRPQETRQVGPTERRDPPYQRGLTAAHNAVPEIVIPRSRGVLLSDGSFLAWGFRGMSNNRLLFWEGPKEQGLPVSAVARIHYSELSEAAQTRLGAAGTGVLLHGGDFVEGEIKELTERQVRVSSVLFGISNYDIGAKAAAVVLRKAVPHRCQYVVRLRNGTILRLDSLQNGKNALLIREGPLKGIRIQPWEISEIRSLKLPGAGG